MDYQWLTTKKPATEVSHMAGFGELVKASRGFYHSLRRGRAASSTNLTHSE